MLYKIVSFQEDKFIKKSKDLKKFLDKNHTYSDENFEYLFVIGGDGSFIHFVKEYAFSGKKIIGIKSGLVSFLSRLGLEDLNSVLDLDFEPIRFLDLKNLGIAINDIYIAGDLFLEADIFINHIFFQKFRGSGILFSTKYGSTAKNKSLKGPILLEADNWIINLIGSQNTSKHFIFDSPIVLSEDTIVEIKNFNMCRIYLDGKNIELSGNLNLELSLKKAPSQVVKFSAQDQLINLKSSFIYE